MSILLDGFNTTITFPSAGTTFVEKEVTPPGVDFGGPIDFTAMRNVRWRTMAPKSLRTLTKMTIKAKYDPLVYNTIVAQGGVNQTITVNFPTIQAGLAVAAHTILFWGWLDKFTPEALKEGDVPLADMEVQPSNINGSYQETAPTIT